MASSSCSSTGPPHGEFDEEAARLYRSSSSSSTESFEPRPCSGNDKSSADISSSKSISLDEALLIADPSGTAARSVLGVSLLANVCGGMAGAVAPFLMEPLALEGNYDAWSNGLHASSTFIGMWLGSFAASAADVVGPGRLMALSMIGIFGGALLQIASSAIAASVASRIFVGLSLVLTYQTSNTYVAEWAQTDRRGKYIAMLHVAIAVGGLCTTAIATVVLESSGFGYRMLLALNALPALIATGVLLPFSARLESPRWLLVAGGPESVDELVRRLAHRTRTSSRSSRLSRDVSRLPKIALHVEPMEEGRSSRSHSVTGGGIEMEPAARSYGATGGGIEREPAGTGRGKHATERTSPMEPLPKTAQGGTRAASTTATAHGSRPWAASRDRFRQLASMWRLHATGALLSFGLNFGSKGSEIWVGVLVGELGQPQLKRSIYFATISGKIAGK